MRTIVENGNVAWNPKLVTWNTKAPHVDITSHKYHAVRDITVKWDTFPVIFVGLPTLLRCAIGAFAQTAAMSGNPHQHKDKWRVDSGCTDHLSPYPEILPYAYESEELTVKIGGWWILVIPTT